MPAMADVLPPHPAAIFAETSLHVLSEIPEHVAHRGNHNWPEVDPPTIRRCNGVEDHPALAAVND